MTGEPRMTVSMQAVLRSLLDTDQEYPTREVFGLELCRQHGLGFGTVYRILSRLHEAGWVNRRVEGTGAAGAQRAARIYYRLTCEGAASARHALAEAAAGAEAERPDRASGSWPAGGRPAGAPAA